MPAARGETSTWKWAFLVLLAIAGLHMAPDLTSLTMASQADSLSRQAAPVPGASSAGMEELTKKVEERVAVDLYRKLKIFEEDMKGQLVSLVDSRLDEKLEEVKNSVSGKSEGHAVSAAPSKEGIPSKDSIRADIDSIIEAKLSEKLDRRIDFRLQKQSEGKGKPAPAPPPNPPPPPPPPADAGGDDGDNAEAFGGGSKCKGSSAAPGVNKDFCGLNEGRLCLDTWEKSYLKENADELSEGFKVLHAPGCFKHGMSVASMGYFRTGSTLLFNTARLWLYLAAGESLVAGYMCPDPKKAGIGVKGAPQEQCSMLCKDHEMKSGVAEHAKVLLMSRRDPFYSVCSRKLMDVWCRKPPSPGPVDWDAIKAYTAKCKETPEMEKEETVKQCHGLMQMQAKIYYERQSAGKTIAYDQLMEDYTRDPASQVREIAKAIGICREAATHEALVKFVVEMGRQLKEHPDQSMDITQMHDVHTPVQRVAKCSNLEAWMREDKPCREWMDANASSSANSELRKLING